MSSHGESAVVVPVPEAEPIVSKWRGRYDSSAARGMPAHITALFPFLAHERLDDSVLSELRDLCAGLPALEIEFRRLGRFPTVLYLDPEPAEGLERLTAAIVERWPEAPPYDGAFDHAVPHLTIAQVIDDRVAVEIEGAVAPQLPFGARLGEARLYVFDGSRWRARAGLPFELNATRSARPRC